MRKFLISAAVAATALAVASPAAAQWYPQQQQQGYGAPYGYGYGYNNNYGQARRLQAQIDSIQRTITRFDRGNQISNSKARALRYRTLMLERQLRTAAYRGLSRNESNVMAQRIAQLGWQVNAEGYGGRRWSGNDRRWDRDGRGRDHRYDREHDRWHDRHDD